MAELLSRKFRVKVIGKAVEPRGFIFRRNAYLIALEFIDPGVVKTLDTWEVAFEVYSKYEVGETLEVEMYQLPNSNWTPDKRVAILSWRLEQA